MPLVAALNFLEAASAAVRYSGLRQRTALETDGLLSVPDRRWREGAAGEVVPLWVTATLRSYYPIAFELDDFHSCLQQIEHENLIRANGWIAGAQQRGPDEPYTTTARDGIIRFRHPEDTT